MAFGNRGCGRTVEARVTHRFRDRAVLVAAAVCWGGLACSRPPTATEFQVGVTREQVIESFGVPAHEEWLLKTDEVIRGPIETFWARVPMRSTVETWVYPVVGGTVELYFVDGSERVQGTAFAPDGGVFEAGRPPSPPGRVPLGVLAQ